MANNKLIYASDARKAILKADPKLAYCIDNIKGVEAVEVIFCDECTKSGWCIIEEQLVTARAKDRYCGLGERREGE